MKKPRFPTVSKRTNPKGNKIVYRINYYNPWEKRRLQIVVGPRKDEALKEASRVYDELISRYFGETSRTTEDITINQIIEEFFSSKIGRVRASTIRRYRIYLFNFTAFMELHFNSIQFIGQVTKAQIEEFLQALNQQGQAPSTINAELRVLRSIFRFALKNNRIKTDPTDLIEKFLDPKLSEEVKYWTEAEVKLILNEVNPFWRDKYEFLYCTGLREGELINLKWDAVDLDDSNPKIKIQASEDWFPKTNQRRELPLNQTALKILQIQTHSSRHEYVFKSFEGNKIKAKTIYDNLKSALKRIGLHGSVHTFRHTFASHLVMNGIGIETVSTLLGHSSIEITSIYAHLAPGHLRKAVDSLMKD